MTKVQFVRHGESKNNVLYSDAVALYGGARVVKNNPELEKKCLEYDAIRREQVGKSNSVLLLLVSNKVALKGILVGC